MKNKVLIAISFFVFTNLFSQKQIIDITAIREWPTLESPMISNDGNYALYNINNRPLGSNTLIVQSTTDNWKKEIIGASALFFSDDSKQAVYKSKDTLYLLQLGSNSLAYISNIHTYKWPSSSKVEWLAYQQKESKKELILRNLFTGKEQIFASVTDYSFDKNGQVLLLKVLSRHDNLITNSLQWVSLPECKITTIWDDKSQPEAGATIAYPAFDAMGKQLVFIVNNKNKNESANSIWYYKAGMDKAEPRVNKLTTGIKPGFSIGSNNLQFSKSGSWIYFQLKPPVDDRRPDPNNTKVDVWSYTDILLQPDQLNPYRVIPPAVAVIKAEGGQVISITDKYEVIDKTVEGDDFILVVDNKCGRSQYWWSCEPASYYLVSLYDGARKLVANESGYTIFSLSPQNNYLVFYNKKQKKYFSYNVVTNKTIDISVNISTQLDDEYPRVYRNESIPIGIAGWSEQDYSLLVYDNYDIWEVDPQAKRLPVNITNGYGNLHHIKFRVVDEPIWQGKSFKRGEPLLLTAFNTINKDNGFYQKSVDKKGNPELLTMGSYILNLVGSQVPSTIGWIKNFNPLKARNANCWIIHRQTSSQPPNYFLTKDFKTFTAATYLQPQKAYQWLTTELITWKQLDGTPSQGVLYKPENFDPSKKYPIIFLYYEQLSSALNAFYQPDLTASSINIPWFVSRGYLVFTPDIQLSVANKSNRINGENAYNSVVSAAQYFSKKPWINATKMGINGHSFGGGLTNYLITHANIFSAAAEAAGGSDGINSYLDVSDRQDATENGQGRMGATPWKRPDLYLRNSSVLKADQVVTPLLIMHNKADIAVPWSQGVAMYLALRRLEKKVWMLQYDNGGHGVFNKDAEDYTIRITQFFNHYLKNAPAPIWMSRGIPARLKGIETGYAYDPSGNCGKDCKVCKTWNDKMAKDSTATWQEIERRKKEEHWE